MVFRRICGPPKLFGRFRRTDDKESPLITRRSLSCPLPRRSTDPGQALGIASFEGAPCSLMTSVFSRLSPAFDPLKVALCRQTIPHRAYAIRIELPFFSLIKDDLQPVFKEDLPATQVLTVKAVPPVRSPDYLSPLLLMGPLAREPLQALPAIAEAGGPLPEPPSLLGGTPGPGATGSSRGSLPRFATRYNQPGPGSPN